MFFPSLASGRRPSSDAANGKCYLTTCGQRVVVTFDMLAKSNITNIWYWAAKKAARRTRRRGADAFKTLAKRESMQISIESLGKIYENGKPALKDINLEISNGMFGLLGPNGAGKTTLMRILVTLMEPTSGRVLVNGADLQKERRNIRSMLGYLPQDFKFFTRLKTWEFLDYIAQLSGVKNRAERRAAIDKMLTQVGLLRPVTGWPTAFPAA